MGSNRFTTSRLTVGSEESQRAAAATREAALMAALADIESPETPALASKGESLRQALARIASVNRVDRQNSRH